jgi:dTDP-4-dehydrorhamnose 3,5-epimerase
MQIEKTALEGVFIIVPDVFVDERGFFMESYNALRYKENGIAAEFVQDNINQSKKGVLRGLHYQVPPFAQGKLVQVLQGKVLDVAVDIRFGSPTFGQHVAIELSGENKKQLWIPEGFAHGLVALEDETIFSYKCSGLYSKEHERGVRWNDPTLGIQWGISEPVINSRDANFPLLADIPEDYFFEKV